jgi:NADPH-dependent 2,4-dienoyl-CoA reductase/sulfur reductase-like enzyme/rhodanese-related sulfurtransferase
VGGEIPAREDLLLQTPQSLKARFNLDVRVNTEVIAIDRAERRVRVRELPSGREYEESYDDLVLSTGAAPLVPPIPGINRPGHFTVRNIPDIDGVLAWMAGQPAKQAVVVGGGYVGLEMAEQLHRKGLQVTVVEALPQIMAPLDPEMAAWLHLELKANEVGLHLNDPVAGFEAPAPGESAMASIVTLRSGKRLSADLVILGLGVRPETGLAKAAGLELGERGGIRVNERLQTSDPHIWAVGDAIEVRDPVTGKWALIPLAGPANRQGRIAADNILGRSTPYRGTWGTAVIRLFSLTAACTGANEKTLRQAGRRYERLYLHPASRAGYYPGGSPIALKVLFCPDTGKLLGAQAVGKDGVDKRMDVLATALQAGLTMQQIAELELCYAPPFGSAKDPVNLAGMAAQNVLAGDVRLAHWDEFKHGVPEGTFLLDVRSDEERKAGAIPGSAHIPLPQLRSRTGELPKDREIIVSCQSGQRSYFACRMLSQRGFRVRNLAGSYRTWKAAQAAG